MSPEWPRTGAAATAQFSADDQQNNGWNLLGGRLVRGSRLARKLSIVPVDPGRQPSILERQKDYSMGLGFIPRAPQSSPKDAARLHLPNASSPGQCAMADAMMAGVAPHLVRTSLLGGAVGDSLGAEIEFWSLARIQIAFPDGLTELPLHDGIRGAITDDTQMTLFTAEGILDAYQRGIERGIWHPPSSVHHALLRWLETQGQQSRLQTMFQSDLIADRRLHVRRAPGLTCLGALQEAQCIGEPAQNESKGCGTIMRVAPTALMLPREMVRDCAMQCSALTHGHPTGQRAAAAWAELLRTVAEGADLESTATAIARDFATLIDDETTTAINKALGAPRDGQPKTLESLGGGWVAEEALAIALYACLAGRSFEHALRIAVTHSGDSDSTGAIAGNMLGLLYPDEVLKHRWTKQVECRDLITKLVASYAEVFKLTETHQSL